MPIVLSEHPMKYHVFMPIAAASMFAVPTVEVQRISNQASTSISIFWPSFLWGISKLYFAGAFKPKQYAAVGAPLN